MAEIYTSKNKATAAGADHVNTLYVRRDMKIYGVTDSELETIGATNTQTSAFFAVGTSAFSFAVAIWVSAAYQNKPTPTGEILEGPVAWGCVALAVFFIFLGIRTYRRRGSLLDIVKRQSEAVPE